MTVTASATTCSWSASTTTPWITINSPTGTVTGSGSVAYSLAANGGTASRSGAINIGGNSFPVTQLGVSCSFSLTPTGNLSVPPAGVTGATISVASNVATCSWTATSNASWITVTAGASGTGNGTVTYNVASNLRAGATFRSGAITVGNQTFTITQDVCSYFISPSVIDYSSYVSTSASVTVSAAGGCGWTAASNAPWITINSGASGSGSGTVQFTIATNTQTTYPTSRTGTLTVAGQTVTITQAGQPACGIGNTGLSSDPNGLQGTSGKCFPAAGSGGLQTTVYVWLARADCPWQPVVNNPWIHATTVDPGSNPRQVRYTVDANPGTQQRVGAIFIDGLMYRVTEGGSDTSAGGRVVTGTGAGLAGVTITFGALVFGNPIPAAVVTDANGYWQQTGFASCAGNYATASKAGYTFTPAPRNFFSPVNQHVDFVSSP